MKKIGIISALFFGLVISQAQAQQIKHQFLLFWRSDCATCEVAIKQLVAKCATLDKDSFTITTISFDTDSIAYFKAIKDHKMDGFDNQYDFKAGYFNNALARKYKVTKTPTLLYVDAQGSVLAQGQEAFYVLNNFKKKEE
jgi:thioredoxin-related protein